MYLAPAPAKGKVPFGFAPDGTGALITFRSSEDYDDAERHKANLEDAPVSNTSTVTIETIPNTRSPRDSALGDNCQAIAWH
jgi:hypothetical protein